MQVEQIFAKNMLRNFNYIIHDGNSAYIVDPYDARQIKREIEKLKLTPIGILNTHQHHDHIRGNNALSSFFAIPILKPSFGEKLKFSEENYLEVIHSPGHTMDHVCFICYKDSKIWSVISGDTLFNAGVGNCKHGGQVEALYNTISGLFSKLPDETIVFPGHDYFLRNLEFSLSVEELNTETQKLKSEREKQNIDVEFIVTTLGLERKINPFLRLNKPSVLEKFKKEESNIDEKQIFCLLRGMRDNW